jgi:hypothetical protein
MPTRLVKKRRNPLETLPEDPLKRLRSMRPQAVALPVSMGHLLSALDDERKRVNRSRKGRLARAWAQALAAVYGPRADDMLRRCEVASFAGGLLRVSTDGPTLAHELGVVRSRALLEALRSALEGKDTVTRLVARPGGLNARSTNSENETEEPHADP